MSIAHLVAGNGMLVLDTPFMVKVADNEKFICSGVILNSLVILTAANCIYRKKASEISIITNTFENDVSDEPHLVQKIIIHENFDNGTLQSNIALLVLSNSVNFKPIQFPKRVLNVPGTANIIFWSGQDKFIMHLKVNRKRTEVLEFKHCNLPDNVVEEIVCANYSTLPGINVITDAGFLVTENSERSFLFGIFNDLPTRSGTVAFTNVAYYGQWIESKLQEENNIECKPHRFLCVQEEKCIRKVYKCNGIDDCEEYNEDEADCADDATTDIVYKDTTIDPPVSSCKQNEYLCSNGTRKCISTNLKCDGTKDCSNGEDEKFCPEVVPSSCESIMLLSSVIFRCLNGSCILSLSVCDGVSDCPNHDDEDKSICGDPAKFSLGRLLSKHCSETELSCATGECVEGDKFCDGIRDCPKEDDEGTICRFQPCQSDSFKCHDGKCIDMSYKCDGDIDCPNGEDEQSCVCSSDKFRCDSGKCIPQGYKCDGDKDCPGGEDEVACTCDSNQFQCNSGKCIPQIFKCDGGKDCPGGEDELSCTCEANQFQCNDGKCVKISYKCDGDNDCKNGEDEQNCTNASLFLEGKCNRNDYTCLSGDCIPSRKNCDGVKNCPGGEDELFCNGKHRECDVNYYRCLNGNCIPSKFVCDGERDCFEGDDEHVCPQISKNGPLSNCNNACRRNSLANIKNDAVRRCCQVHGGKDGFCRPGDIAICILIPLP